MRLVAGLIVFATLVAGRAGAQKQVATTQGRYIPLQTMRDGRAKMPAALARRVTVGQQSVPLQNVLLDIANQAGLGLSYSDEVARSAMRVSITVVGLTAADALARAVEGTPWSVLVTPQGQVTVVLAERGAPGAVVGRVADSATGRAVTGVEVFLEKTRWHDVTDTNGLYHLADVDSGSYLLAFRRLGYAKQNRTVAVRAGETDTVNAVLVPVAARLQELVTTATGQQRRLQLGNDIIRINADSIVRSEPVRSVTDLLEGRVPGLAVQRTSGAPGDPARLRLRGAGSPRLSNDPIVIVDGMRIYAEQSAARSANLAGLGLKDQGFSPGLSADTGVRRTTSYATPSPLDNIDPNSIETINIMKGPSAATLYGQDAANGVIIITTKRGKAGPPRWTMSADYGQARLEGNYPDLVVRWGHGLASNVGVGFCPLANVTSLVETEPPYNCVADSISRFQLLNNPTYTVLGRGHNAKGTLGVSGGSAALTYSVTGTYREEQGLPQLPAYEADRYTSRVGTAPPDWMRRPQNLTEWGVTNALKIRLNANADLTLQSALSRVNQQRSSLEQQLGTLMTTYLDPVSGVYYTPGSAAYAGLSNVTDNMLTGYFERATSHQTTFRNGAALNWRPGSVFAIDADVGVDIQQRTDEIFLPVGAATGNDSIGHVYGGHGLAVTSTVNLRASTRELSLGRHARFRFASGMGYVGTSIRDENVQTVRLAPGTALLGDSVVGTRRNLADYGTFRVYAEPAVNVLGLWFTLGLQLHQQGTTDGAQTRGFFDNLKDQLKFPPSFNTSYVISDKPFFPFKDLFQSFRLRTAFGRSGRQPGPADRLRLYGATSSQWADSAFGAAVLLQTLGNTQLRPERTIELEGGFDADLLDSRLSVELTGYRKTTDDMILGVPVPQSVYGGGTIQKNIGQLQNTGVELHLTAQLLRRGPIALSTDFGFSKNRNLVVKLAPGVTPFYTETNRNGDGGIRVAPGYPLFGRWSVPVVGYADANGDGVLESEEVVLGDTAVYVGETVQSSTFNIHPMLSLWRGMFEVRAGFFYDGGVAQRNEVAALFAPFSPGRNDPSSSLADQLASSGVDYTSIQTVSTLRLQDISIAYRVPPPLARRVGADNLTVFLQGTNLGLWTNYRGLDPSVNAYATGNNLTDTGILPQPRTWQVRVSAAY